MGRPPRCVGEGLTYHVTMRGNRRQAIFFDDQDRHKFIALLEAVAARRGWQGWAWCLMTNHVHLCLTTLRPSLSDGMRDLFGQYARFIHWKYELADHLFRNRFHSVEILDERQLLAVIRYTARNPLRAGIADEISGWPWSSLHQVLSLDSEPTPFIDPARILDVVHPRSAHARLLLRRIVESEADDTADIHPIDLPNVVALSQLLPPREAARQLSNRGLAIRQIALLLDRSEGAVRYWLRSAAVNASGV